MAIKHSVEEISLKSGAKLLLIDVPDATVVSYLINFRAGDSYVPDPAKDQTAHIMEHMAFGANKLYPSSESFSQEFTKNGAYSNATTSDVSMNYIAESAIMEWDRILDLEELSVTQPKFIQKELDSEKGNVREELVNQANNYRRVLWQRIEREMGASNLLDSEKLETIDAVTLADIKAHHAHTHTLANMRISLAGDLGKHKDEIIKKLSAWELPTGEELPVKNVPMKSSGPIFIKRKELANLYFGFNIVLNRSLSYSDIIVMRALNHILTGTFHSRIFGKARSRGICYSMGSNVSPDVSGVTSWEIMGQVGAENGAALFRLIRRELMRVADEGISEQELKDAKQFMLGSFQMQGQTVPALNDWYADDYFDFGEFYKYEDHPVAVNSVTLAKVKKLANEFMNDGVWTLGGVGNITKKEFSSYYQELSKLFNRG